MEHLIIKDRCLVVQEAAEQVGINTDSPRVILYDDAQSGCEICSRRTPPHCGGSISGVDALITSPGYPNNYAPHTICHWLINVPPGEMMTLTVEELNMENDCTKDFLMIKNGYHTSSPVLGRFCGTHAPAPITTTENFLTVYFQTDAYGSAPGFKLTTREVQRGKFFILFSGLSLCSYKDDVLTVSRTDTKHSFLNYTHTKESLKLYCSKILGEQAKK
ncbi:cubilin [Trichonephila clavipes]|nr:cubilin [Trichonephila clavipes]